MKAYSQDLRDRAILLFESGHSRIQISCILDIHYETTKEWIRRYTKDGDYSSKQHLNKGATRRFTDKAAVLLYLESHPNALACEIRDAVAPELPISTFKDSLSRMGITYKKKRQLILREMKTNEQST
jgi:transposase